MTAPTTPHTPQLRQGVVGWHNGFEGSALFPADLPTDWRLTYLTNEIHCVAIPQHQLEQADDDTVMEWEEEVHEQARFYLLLEEPAVEPDHYALLLQRLQPLRRQLLGVIAVTPQPHLSGLDGLSAAQWSQPYRASLWLGSGVALTDAAAPIPPQVARGLVERIRRDEIETLLWYPGPALLENIETVDTIALLL